jgi:cytidyltransferase-like protein
MNDIKTGVFLARMQPVHNAHLFIVEKACQENDQVIVMLGSANKESMLRNPFPIDLRTYLLKQAIAESIGQEFSDKIKVYEIPDWSHEKDYENQKEWGKYLYYNIVSRANTKTFSIYFNDDPNIMLNWFDEDLERRIDFKFLERNCIFEGLSATKIREAFESGDITYVRKYCPNVVVREFELLRGIWEKVRKNPQNDFSMN